MLKPILLVEDNPNDRELTLIALQSSNLANDVVIAKDRGAGEGTAQSGHHEYQKLSSGGGRACPGAYGMILVDMLRREYKLGEPKK